MGVTSQGSAASHSPALPLRGRQLMVTAMLFCSGGCALVYQVSWFRQFRYFFGASTMASAAVVAIFIAGLGLGSLVFGKVTDRKARPLGFYGGLELGIGLLAGASVWLMTLVQDIYISLGGIETLGSGGAFLVRMGLSLIVIGGPTFLMGGTLPAAVNAVVSGTDKARAGVGLLYGGNTLGAFCGGFVATYLLHEYLGTKNTLLAAAALNMVVALVAILVSRGRWFPAVVPQTAESASASEDSSTQAALPASRTFVLVSATLVGFIFFMQEMVWYRMLGPILGGSTYTIALVLCMALLGIGIGGLLYPLWRGKRPATLAAFSLTCGLEAACIAFPFWLGDDLAVMASVMVADASSFHDLVQGWMVILAIVVLPASIVTGVQFPLLIGLLGSGRRDLGKEVGLAYVFNSGGAILGSLAGGFGLLILLSAPGAWRVSVWTLTVLAAVALMLAYRRKAVGREGLFACVCIPAAVWFSFALGPTAAWRHSGIGAGLSLLKSDQDPIEVQDWKNIHRRQIVWDKDGIESSIGISDADGYKFIVNGKTDGNSIYDAHTQIMSGMIGAILHGKAQKSLVIGLGTGSTSGWLASIPSMQRVDTVELEPAVLHMAELSESVNQNVLDNPKSRIIMGDAREYLLTTQETYDLIFSEPSNPYRAGIASLYTVEFYREAHERLAEDGVFLQFLQGYMVDKTTVQRVYSTLGAVFESVETWLPGGADLVLVARKRKGGIHVPDLRARLSASPYAEALLAAWGVVGLEGFLSRYLANDAFCREMAVFSGEALNTDDRTYLEFAMARTVGHKLFDPHQIFVELKPEQRRPQIYFGDVDWEEVEEYRINLIRDGFPLHRLWPTASAENPSYLRAEAIFRHLDADRLEPDYPQKLDEAVAIWDRQPKLPKKPMEWLMVAEWAALRGDGRALKLADQVGVYMPIEADLVRAMYALRVGNVEGAVQMLESAYQTHRTNPWADSELVESSFSMASLIASNGEAWGERLLDALSQPFAAHALDFERELALVNIHKNMGLKPACAQVFFLFEPHVLWQEDFLQLRLECYRNAEDPKLEQAQEDLARFLKSK